MVEEVKLRRKYLNEGDVFILDDNTSSRYSWYIQLKYVWLRGWGGGGGREGGKELMLILKYS